MINHIEFLRADHIGKLDSVKLGPSSGNVPEQG